MSLGVPGPVARIVTLVLTPMYLVLLAAVLALTSGMMMIVAVGIVFTGAVAICLLITAFCSRLAQLERAHSGYSIDMLMMITAVFAIYFAYLSQVFQGTDLDVGNFVVATISIEFVVLTTIILIRFTDSLIELIKTFAHVFSIKDGRQS